MRKGFMKKQVALLLVVLTVGLVACRSSQMRQTRVPNTFVLYAAEALIAGDRNSIASFVTWSETPQGHSFWRAEQDRLMRGEDLSPMARQIVVDWIMLAKKRDGR